MSSAAVVIGALRVYIQALLSLWVTLYRLVIDKIHKKIKFIPVINL